MPTGPSIGIVVVHYGTDELTMRCLRALIADDRSPAAEIVLVDNDAAPGFAGRVAEELPTVRVVRPGANLGFAGGCNAGIAALAPSVELVALVNSDIEVPRGWLVPLEETLRSDEHVAAVCPKIRLDGWFHTVELRTEDTWTPGRGDRRPLAWRLDAARAGDLDVTGSCRLVEGFWEPEVAGTWAGPTAILRVPAVPGADVLHLEVGTPPGREVVLHVTGLDHPVPVPAGGGTCAIPLVDEPAPVLNNVGNLWRPDGYGVDVGLDEVDAGQHDEPRAIEAWCGGAVLLRRAYLDATGGFDERLFLYYEDLELSLRGAALGWRYRYDPRSVVAHRHGASAAQQRRRVARLKERNRLLVLARHAPTRRFGRQLLRYVAVTGSYVRRDVVAPLLRGDRPRWATVADRVAALVAAVPRLPGMLASRVRDRRARGGMQALA